MSKRILLLCILGIVCLATFFLLLIHAMERNMPTNSPEPAAVTMPDSKLTWLEFREEGASLRRVQGYAFRQEQGRSMALFDMAREEVPYEVHVDQAWVDRLTDIIRSHGLMAWDGFRHNASGLLDGTRFHISFGFENGVSVSADAYGGFPEGYTQAAADMAQHFMQLLPEDMRDW